MFYPARWIHCGGLIPLVTYREIFVENDYSPPISLPAKARIMDIGAPIGLATLYFAGRYPDARIDSYEANPTAGLLLGKKFSPDCPMLRLI